MIGYETFGYRGWEWDIDRARQLAADRAPVEIPVAEFAPMINTRVVVDGTSSRHDLGSPVLVTDLASPVDGHTRLLIDGWHRMNLAAATGVPTLPAQILTAVEGLSVSTQFIEGDDARYCYCDYCDADIEDEPA